ncbi:MULTISPECIES: adenylyl cyclase [unclassified Isoptericola]|uniref:adenylyl cyclase n=1 Tax=unclassified Isoptericola TaxID=2623355 RepID=UPI0027142830|nr:MULTISPECIES: adenylyl cyclase [unclassified Isoptericola]MDO8145576.1 adenylyl cyclase [Isoptericola sp. 178]MDO8149228.1 adenylyl cyclase [Isoptericola sp. b515]
MSVPSSRGRPRRALALGAAAAVLLTGVGAAQASPPDQVDPFDPDLGPNVMVFDPSTPQAEIETALDELAEQQTDAEMSTDRYSVLFKPGSYGSAEDPLQARVGYYTEVAGLGASPGDVDVRGAIEVYNRCLNNIPGSSNCIALVNFWRTLSNLHLTIDSSGQDGCRASANFWAVSQAVSMRRLDVDGFLSLMDYCTDGPHYASGGFIADSRFDTPPLNGSQQQWLTRNSEMPAWSNAVWNQVFSGVVGAPDDSEFPSPPYTTLDETPVSREKPYLFVDDDGRWNVRVPAAQTGTRGVSWADGMTEGRTIGIEDFFVAQPGDSVREINTNLARGKHLLLTPGVYDVAETIEVKRPDTVVLGMGHATLTAVDGATPMRVADVPGAVVAGVTIDAGETESELLLQVGKENGDHENRTDPANPTTLSDVYFRVGGPHVGSTDTALEVNSDNVLIDHTWVWRGDHGVEGFPTGGENGVNGDTVRWNTNIGRTGVRINGDDVTATGLFVEHFQEFNTVWNGERGTTVLYQNELPYDPPTQADWTRPDGTLGYAGYKVADDVTEHTLHGGGVYVFNQNNPDIVTENGFEVPDAPGVKLHHIMTVNLSAGTINHVVNGVGDAVPPSTVGVPEYLVEYPAP